MAGLEAVCPRGFRAVYSRNLWGGQPGEFCSGAGSLGEEAQAYARVVRDFVGKRAIKSIVDLGCGDFRVGRMLRMRGVHYLGDGHSSRAHSPEPGALWRFRHTEFVCSDFLQGDLPTGELCLLRQVLQHLSNTEISIALSRLSRFPYVLITEHYPAAGRAVTPNLDKPAWSGHEGVRRFGRLS